MMGLKKICAVCGKEIDEYIMVGDNFLQQKYFDSAEDNVFCSIGCLCSTLSLIEVDENGNEHEFVPF